MYPIFFTKIALVGTEEDIVGVLQRAIKGRRTNAEISNFIDHPMDRQRPSAVTTVSSQRMMRSDEDQYSA
jgi:hypothetical protein